MKKILIVLFLLSSFTFTSFANITDSFPQLTGRVVDNANLLSQSQKDSLTQILKTHEEKTSNQIVVLTLKSLDGYEIADYSYQLGRYWQIGQKDKNNGVLLVIALNDKKLRIEVGYGLEGALTDKISHEIIEYTLKPKFRVNQYYSGIQSAVNKIIQAINGEYKNDGKVSKNSDNEEFFPLIFFAVIFLSILGNGLAKTLRKQALYKATKASIPSSFFGFFVYAMSSAFTSYNIILALIIFVVVFVFNFINTRNVDFNKLKSIKDNSSNRSRSGFGGFSNRRGGGFTSRGGGFSGGGGGFGGGGASGGW